MSYGQCGSDAWQIIEHNFTRNAPVGVRTVIVVEHYIKDDAVRLQNITVVLYLCLKCILVGVVGSHSCLPTIMKYGRLESDDAMIVTSANQWL